MKMNEKSAKPMDRWPDRSTVAWRMTMGVIKIIIMLKQGIKKRTAFFTKILRYKDGIKSETIQFFKKRTYTDKKKLTLSNLFIIFTIEIGEYSYLILTANITVLL